MVESQSGPVATAGDVHQTDAQREAREQLAATDQILSVLSVSSSTAEDVFEVIVDRARALCRADVAQVHLVRGDEYYLVRSAGTSADYLDFASTNPISRDRRSLIGRVSLDHSTQQIADVLADPEYTRPEVLELQRRGRYRTIMGAPMLVHGEAVGVLTVWRTVVQPFDERTCAMLTSFATQGALALRNVELLRSLEARSADLARRVEQLEALSEVGEAVSSSLDADEVLTTIVTLAVQLSGTDGGSLMEYDEMDHVFRVRTAFGTSSKVLDALRTTRIHIEETVVGRAGTTRAPVEIPDMSAVDRDPHLTVLYDAGWRSLLAVPMLRADRVVGAMVVRRKTTGRFSAETKELLEAFASQSAIALTNARLYQQLEQQSQDLAEASRHKSEFLASMSHELRTPLNAVIGFSEVLLERMFGELNDRQDDYLRDILSSGKHLLALLNDVLDLSKVEAGQMDLDLTTFSVQEALSYSLSMVRERAAAHGIELRLTVGPDVGQVTADELRFKQVLLNLVSNAVKFTPDGGLVEVAVEVTEDEVRVTVSDTGAGIAEEDRERIFDSFQQGARSAAKAEGTGLGLTLTRRIVDLHGGRMWLESEPGRGSTFGFAVPARPGSSAGPDASTTGPGAAVPDPRPEVVVIEDDRRAAELLHVHLEAAGFRPVVVPAGDEGLSVVRAHRPVAVVLDIRLPGMDGWEVLAALKDDPQTATIPVVIVSVTQDRGRAFALGASDYLVKPIGRDQLLDALRRSHVLPPGLDGRPVAVFVDDDPLALELVRLTLEPVGWQVRTCTTAEEALEAVTAVQPSVVLVDLLMPDTDGFAVVDRLRADPRTADLPVVVLTAKSLTAADRALLEGRISFVAEKNAVELGQLARRLARFAVPSIEVGEAG